MRILCPLIVLFALCSCASERSAVLAESVDAIVQEYNVVSSSYGEFLKALREENPDSASLRELEAKLNQHDRNVELISQETLNLIERLGVNDKVAENAIQHLIETAEGME